MLEIGEIRGAKEIDKTGGGKYIWQACADCGLERWVMLQGGKPNSFKCHQCGAIGGGSHHNGYIIVRLHKTDPLYPMAGSRRRIREHRLVMARHLGRCLQSWETVHHINGIRDDNRIENLQLVSAHSHSYTDGYRVGYKQGFIDGRNL